MRRIDNCNTQNQQHPKHDPNRHSPTLYVVSTRSETLLKSISKMGFSAILCTHSKALWIISYLTPLIRCLLSQEGSDCII